MTHLEIVKTYFRHLNKAIKQSHNTPVEEQGERRYSSYSFTT
jgi:hypothetical protein